MESNSQKKQISSNKALSILTLFASFFFFTSSPIYAANFKLDKTRIVLDESTRRDEIRIYNDSDILQSFKVTLIEMEMNEQGELVQVEKSNRSAKPYLKIGPRVSRDVKPHTYQRVRVIKKKTPTQGEYRSHLIIEALSQEPIKQVSGIFIRPNFKYVIPIFVTNKQGQSELEFGKPEVTKDGKMLLVINRKGQGTVNGNIVIKNKNNEEIFRANQVSIYPEIDSRTLQTDLIYDDLNGQVLSLILENPLETEEVLAQHVLKL